MEESYQILIALIVAAIALIGLTATVVGSHVSLKRDVKHIRKCVRLSIRSGIKTRRMLMKHLNNTVETS